MSAVAAPMTHAEPLASPPPRSEALGLFLRHAGIDAPLSPSVPPSRRLLAAMSAAFARIPYENLTKIIKLAETGSASRARRTPLEVIAAHAAHGTGGTCFSLTAALLHLLRAAGFEAQPLLADRSYGPDTHCALSVRLDGEPYLVDPGYLIVEPVPLVTGAQMRIETAFNEVRLVPREGGERLELHTVQGGHDTLRLTFTTAPVDPGRFLRAWDASFGWEMMRYPVVTRVAGGRHLYLQARRFQVRDREGVERQELAESDVIERIAEFGIERAVAARALEILRRR